MVWEKVGALCVLCVPLMGLNVEEEKKRKGVKVIWALQLQNKPLETQAMHAHKSLSVWNFNQNQVLDEETTNVKLSSCKTKKVMTGVGWMGSFFTIENEPNVVLIAFFWNSWQNMTWQKCHFQVCASRVFFFFSILWCSHHTGNHRQEVLAKFGYSSERKVEKFQHPDIFWQANGTYCDSKKKKSSKSGDDFQCNFFHKSPLHVAVVCFSVAKWQNSP
jgi:hypothetical protein